MKVTIYTIHVGLAVNGDIRFSSYNRALLLDILRTRHPSGFTIFDGIGCFEGSEEPGCSVVIIDENDSEDFIRETAKLVRCKLDQSEVWLTSRTENLERLTNSNQTQSQNK